ncbi:hypothetical protein SUGI_0299790 [Cryptomeria japonica]|nr:hypothetical protein SUGI_0299790 [Cryptomeria japonica]
MEYCGYEFELVSSYSDPSFEEKLFLNGEIRPLSEQQEAESFKSILIKPISETPTKNQKRSESFDVDVSFSSPSKMECSFEFELVSAYSNPACAEELFINGKIRPLVEQKEPKSFKSISHIDGENLEGNHPLPGMKNKGPTSLRDLLWNEQESGTKSFKSTIDEDKLLLIRQAIHESIKKCRDERNFPRPKQDTKNDNQNLKNSHVYDKKAESVDGVKGLAHQLQVFRSPAEKINRKIWFLPYIQCVLCGRV